MEDKIIADLKESYGITFNQMTPVMGGLLNKRWKVSTEFSEGTVHFDFILEIKMYSPLKITVP